MSIQGNRPHMRNPFRITPIAYQELKEAELPPPAAVISLDSYDVKVIQEYRAAKEAWDKVLKAADANRLPGGTLWRDEDMAAIEAATATLRGCEISMAVMFSHLAKRGGV